MADPYKMNPERTKRIMDAIKVGATYDLAAKYGGITYRTLRKWLTQGENEDSGPCREFFDAFMKAEGEAGIRWLAKIEAAANETWQAAAWKLERRYPRDYGRTVVESDGGLDLTFTIKGAPKPEEPDEQATG